MACFLVPATEAVVTTIATKIIEKKENVNAPVSEDHTEVPEVKLPLSKKMKWLNGMLWGGSLLLAYEHLWHGEVVPYFPFLTAASNAEDAAEMLHEMSTVGVTMAVLVTCIWGGMVAIANVITSRKHKAAEAENQGE